MIRSPLPAGLKTGILHLGLGAFHRAHQADYTHDAIAASGGDWGIEAVSMRDPALAEVLARQDGRFTLVERAPEGPVSKEITVIRHTHALPGNAAAVAARMADPAIHVVTITVTEKGYGADVGARRLNRADPAVAHDLAAPEEAPRSLAGLLCLGLGLRRAAGLDGLTLMSCDNLPDNGHVLRGIVLDHAGHTDPALSAWIAGHCTFPCSMVDRITPATTAETLALAGGDPAAVETEPFRQWVIEDAFAGPHPDWAAAGALIVADVRPFETMKLRLLNGAHSFLAYAGALLGLEFVRDVMADPLMARAVRRHMDSAAASLEPIPGFDPQAYIQALLDRFANPAIAHRCLQIAMDGSQKLPQRLFAPALDLAARDLPFDSCATATAVWLHFLAGRDAEGRTLPLVDPLADRLIEVTRLAGDDAGALVQGVGPLLGSVAETLWARPGWQASLARALVALRQDGLRPVLARGA
ncbi:mannitol dehydrogenase family protein [Thetidibacter halocola]|uniref:Mannitol dehydrogenase family protein n=1 Tax=Thetidibacter halocola TaxID=2827239 RepID=A0A8J8B9B0_9RHOB|nr:mannitol dehydrogenase family protein [Thetidibacter halocola]MBS0125370.1 mannitol dehydrogenase family protein [Thetidibacter halocola]